MHRPRIVIELSPSRLEVAIQSGRAAVAVHRERLCLPKYGERWEQTLASLQQALTNAIEKHHLQGAEATLLYISPTAATNVFSCAARIGRAKALSAGRLALAEAVDFPLTENPHDVRQLAKDKPSHQDDDRPSQIHTLGIADRQTTVSAAADWIRSAGLTLASLVPMEAPTLAAAVQCAVEHRNEGATVALYIGEHVSAMAATSGGRLRFVRRMGIGLEAFVDALLREVATAPDAPPVRLSSTQAQQILLAFGIPVRGQVVEPTIGLQSDVVLPLLQPLVQRCVLEIRQSLRFGLSEQERAGARLLLCGPGASLPRFAEVLADQCQLQGPGSGEPAPIEPGFASSERGIIAAWHGVQSLRIGLLPDDLSRDRMMKRVRRGMAAGAAAAGVVIAADGIVTRYDLSQERQNLHSLETRIASARGARDMNAQFLKVRSGVTSAQNRANQRVTSDPPWDAVLIMLAQMTPEDIRLTEIHLTTERSGPTCRIQGHAPLGLGNTATALQRYMDTLAELPIVRHSSLGATNRIQLARGTVQQFEITLLLVDLPPDLSLERALAGAAMKGAP